ncbi:MAG TPA: lytic transglycosylase domain-containing protein [Solirubrobacteraceae bacterium]|nr:lytic transglycosylase domain-containing protein [Solirubrobacteraceae bacterium]
MSAGALAGAPAARPRGARRLALGGSVIALCVFLALATIAAITGVALQEGAGEEPDRGDAPSALARKEIPARYLDLYERAARRYGLDWAVLAAIGRVECDHGRDPDPSCAREGATNGAGAGGPMQFVSATWSAYGVDGDGDGRADRWDAADAIFGAANYLLASGAPRDYRHALFAYNHAGWYVDEVLRWAARYRGSTLSGSSGLPLPADAPVGAIGLLRPDLRLQAETVTPVRFLAGPRATLAPHDGHLALVPAQAPAVVQAMVVAGNELQQLPYGPGGHPDPRGALEEDCSSTVNYVLYRAGIRPIQEILKQNPLAQDYVGWGAPGPGRWVTIYATTAPTAHVFMTIAGLRLDTSRNGTDTGPNAGEGGPRWRVLDHIPTWARWSVRHPPGL